MAFAVRVIAVGSLKDRFCRERCEEYLKWLRPFGAAEVVEIADSDAEREGEAICRILNREKGYVVVLAEEGHTYTSEEFSGKLSGIAQRLIFVIGGPFGLADSVKQRADLLFSLSPLTFTHELARVLLLEQLFRAVSIAHGRKYHHR
ncbi:MAG: 23S rRNA (pseudouridine(1915)-N(3))-methyltransferase RlmH [Victivallaceae bacterium]|nr:23S rRNA (pseudouridine(1915)-N(3))-methyltransferase RlmH [Victivallaceae bacterium]